MPKLRNELITLFRDGARPIGNDFKEFINSFIHRTEDGFGFGANGTQIDNFTLGSFSSTPKEGSMRFAAGEVQFWDGVIWKSLNSPEFGFKRLSEQSASIQADIAYHGRAGINLGSSPAGLTDDLEVGAPNTTTKARVGTAAIGGHAGNGTRAMFFHTGVRAVDAAHNNGELDQNYAFAQDAAGRAYINTIGTLPLSFRTNNTERMSFANGVLTIGTPSGNPVSLNPPANSLLNVHGEAAKYTGGASWQIMSDVRTKKEIIDFEDGLDKLLNLRTVRFKYNGLGNTIDNDVEQVGMIGQEVEAVFPYMVRKSPDTNKRDADPEDTLMWLDTSPLIFIVVNAIREIDNKIKRLEQLQNQAHA